MNYKEMWEDLKITLKTDSKILWLTANDDIRLNGKLEGVKLALQKIDEIEKIFMD